MSHHDVQKPAGLPDNAYTELKPGEEYVPVMSPDKDYPEVNARSVTWGLIMAVLFSAAAAYLGLRIGQVFEAAIPIAIIAVGLSTLTKRKNALGENVIGINKESPGLILTPLYSPIINGAKSVNTVSMIRGVLPILRQDKVSLVVNPTSVVSKTKLV